MTRNLVAGTVIALALTTPAFAATYNTLSGQAPLVIAHRGASGYLPEHTLGAYELAIRMGADVVEPDLQTTRDGVLVAMHDSTLTRTTNVEDLFAPRNGGYRVSDFTLAEIKTLTVEPTRTASTSYPGYTPSMSDPFTVPTFAEVMEFVNAHNTTSGAKIGIYPEAKTPNSFAMNAQILEEMQSHGFTDRSDNSFIQTFSHEGARQLSLMQDILGMDNAIAALGYAQLTPEGYALYDSTTRTSNLLSDLALFVDGLGVSLGGALSAEFIAEAHALGLQVHGWTFRPTTAEAAEEQFLPWLEAGMDGFFTDYSLLAVEFLEAHELNAVPVPAGLPLLAGGFGALALLRRRRTA
ncbi:glycerophosphoryl diester phosphodiesterase [Primorskyibacter flagellatus]|uniref:glycerophosphodiester phosphodiesterase n=1 Tax=Primorskyibacter flagellatus TaxID=1387277 RepID=A0A917ABQ1_9RHOB|nr:glycerophosphodiester phosphodiesterase family protein [Primorskyibacter flagellatus]GGE37234.1 glycerophosphoryl diester phosphodiesterase [Primorskyibacter flagellatus]